MLIRITNVLFVSVTNSYRTACRSTHHVWRRFASHVEISKNPSLADEAVDISISGLQPRQNVSLHGSTTLPSGITFESLSHYTANDQGLVTLNKAASHGGTYKDIEPMGPFWSMVPSPFNKRKHERFAVKDPTRPFHVDLSVYDGFIPTLEDVKVAPQSLAKSSAERMYMGPGVTEHEVNEGSTRGTLYLPPGDGPFPGVISMSGAGVPGALKHKASLLASRGFATLALRYYGTDDLPTDPFKDVDLMYFEDAAIYLKNHPKINGKNGVAMVGICYGGRIALAYASVAPPGMLNSVVAISSMFYPSKQFHYKDFRFKTPPGFYKELLKGPEQSTIWNFVTEVDIENPENIVQFHKRHDISFLLIYGSNDGYFRAKPVAVDAHSLLESQGHQNYKILFYPETGHLIEHAYHPHGRIVFTHTDPHYQGGEQPHHSKAEIDAYPQILKFVGDSFQKANS